MKFYQEQKTSIQSFLNDYFKLKRKELSRQYDWAGDAIDRLEAFVLPGKMVRGGLVVLSARPKGKTALRDAIAVGSALELLHSGILIHDDIMDQDKVRRGLPTLFAQYADFAVSKKLPDSQRYGESMGACVGIIAYFFAMEMIASIRNTKAVPTLMALFGQEMAALGLAQMMDVDGGYHRVSFKDSDVRKLYEQKTGRYTFTLPLRAGRVLAGGSSNTSKDYESLGKELGMVFQLQDDLLSLRGNPKVTGKPLGSDVREKKQTQLYLELLRRATLAEQKQLRNIYRGKKVSASDVKFVLGLMDKYGVFVWASKKVKQHQQKALAVTDRLNVDRFTKTQLEELLNFLINRTK